jgi:hypothetical protein
MVQFVNENQLLKLEPEVGETTRVLEDATALSIAISLKRIADELCGNNKVLGLIDTLFECKNS